MNILLMGVSGTGKSHLGNMLSRRLGFPLLEGDDYHSRANREKMKRGQPLTAQDRVPWLKNIAREILKRKNNDLIVSCSALKQSYRKLLMSKRHDWLCVYLKGPKELIHKRLLKRKGHFYNPDLLESQLATLEEPKNAITLDIAKPPEYLIAQIIKVADKRIKLSKQNLGVIGLGKMGFPVVENLMRQKLFPVVFDREKKIITKIAKKGGSPSHSIKNLISKIESPRVVILLLPAGGPVQETLIKLSKGLTRGDFIIDMGNSFYQDTIENSKMFRANGIGFIDIGISGGIPGAKHGGCLMIGGKKKDFLQCENIFKVLSKNNSYQYLGKSGAGHMVKGYHNLVEYGILQALAEGLVSIRSVSESHAMKIDLTEVCSIWNQGSIVESRLARDILQALIKNPNLKNIKGTVKGQTQKEMGKLVQIANRAEVETPVSKAAVNYRLKTLNCPSLIGKIINAARNIFGGHQEWRRM